MGGAILLSCFTNCKIFFKLFFRENLKPFPKLPIPMLFIGSGL
jgi:hypothetical protein